MNIQLANAEGNTNNQYAADLLKGQHFIGKVSVYRNAEGLQVVRVKKDGAQVDHVAGKGQAFSLDQVYELVNA